MIFLFALGFVWFLLSGSARLPSIQVLPWVLPCRRLILPTVQVEFSFPIVDLLIRLGFMLNKFTIFSHSFKVSIF
jgi:hypothetical protein